MLQYVAFSCLLLCFSQSVYCWNTDDDAKDPQNATISQRALSVFSVVKVKVFRRGKFFWYEYIFSFPTQLAHPQQRVEMEPVTLAQNVHLTGEFSTKVMFYWFTSYLVEQRVEHVPHHLVFAAYLRRHVMVALSLKIWHTLHHLQEPLDLHAP